jgi:hypothetical protein
MVLFEALPFELVAAPPKERFDDPALRCKENALEKSAIFWLGGA